MIRQPNLLNVGKFGCFVMLTDYSRLVIEGSHAKTFLHAQTTNDVNGLKSGFSQYNAVLDRKARVQSLFNLFNTSDEAKNAQRYKIIDKTSIINEIREYLDKLIFNAKVNIEQNSDASFLLIHGLNQIDVLAKILNLSKYDVFKILKSSDYGALNVLGNKINYYKEVNFNEPSLIVELPKDIDQSVSDFIVSTCKSENLIELDVNSWRNLQLEWGQPRFKEDFDSSFNLLETSLDFTYANYNKGCFPGQEFLNRIKTHNAVNQALFGLIFTDDISVQTNLKNLAIIVNDKEIGKIINLTTSSLLAKPVAIVILNKEFRIHGKPIIFTLNSPDLGAKYTGSITRLPFVTETITDKSIQLSSLAMKEYLSANSSELIDKVTDKLIKALYLYPQNEDAMEALAVISEKNNKLDEAIKVIKDLIELNPNSIMAHTNLSIFYMQKGLIDKAEEEKAISTTLRMTQAVKDINLPQDFKEITRRLDMFKEVLAIDPNDAFANFEAGTCLYEMDKFSESIPYFQNNLKNKPNNIEAYLKLAKIYVKLNQPSQAQECIEKGIILANQKNEIKKISEKYKNEFKILIYNNIRNDRAIL